MSYATLVRVNDPYHPRRDMESVSLECSGPISALAPDTVRPFIILRNGEAVLRKDWGESVNQGDILVVVMLPRGGGKSNPLRLILTIVVMVFAWYAAPALLGYGAGAAGWAAAGAAGAVGMATLAQGAIGLVGSALVNAIGPKPKPPSLGAIGDHKAASPTYNISAQGNQARLEAAIPEHFGRMVAYPDYAAAPCGEFINNEQHLYQLFCIGVGSYEIEKIRIAETDISSFAEVSYQVVNPGEALTLFPAAVSTATEVSGQEAFHDTPIGPFSTNGPGTTTTRIAVDVTCPVGLYYANDSGSLDTRSVSFKVEAQAINDSDQPVGSWFILGTETISAATNTAQQLSYGYDVIAGRYQVRLTRTNAKDTSTRAGNTLVWVGLRAYLLGPNTFGDVTLLAIKMRASNNLSNQSSRKINVIATRKLPIYDGQGGWYPEAPTRSIAWAIAYICKRVGLPDNRIDLKGLKALAETWRSRGDTFDARFDNTSTFWQVLNQVALAGRAKAFMQGGIVYVWRDQPQAIPTTLFSMRNISKNSFNLEFLTPGEDTADAVEVSYFDESVWAPRHLLCKLPDSNAERPAKVDLFGVVNRAQAYREGLYMAAANRYRRTLATFQTEMEGYIPSYGSLVTVTHELPQWGQTFEAVEWSAWNRTLTLTDEPTWISGQDHYVGLRRRNGSVSGPYKVQRGIEANQIIIDPTPESQDPTFRWSFDGNAERTHVVFGAGSRWRQRALVMEVKPKDLHHVELKVVIENDLVHTADGTSTVPALIEDAGKPFLPVRPTLTAIYVAQDGDPVSPVITVSWSTVAGATLYKVEWSANGDDWLAGGESAGTSVNFSVAAGVLFIRARAIGAAPGPWLVWSGSAGDVPVPGKPQNLELVEAWVSTKASWKWDASPRAASYDVEINAGGSTRRSYNTTATTYTYDAEQVLADGGPWRSLEIKVRAVGPLGSSDWASLTSTNPQVGQLQGVVFASGYEQIICTYVLPNDTDFTGVKVAMSKTSGFDPNNAASHVYDGYDQVIVLTHGPGSATLNVGDTWYFQIAAYDKFGKDGLQWSGQHFVKVEGADPELTPEQVLAKLNSSFIQGNVVLSGAGVISVYRGSPSTPNRDFVALTSGNIDFKRYRNGAYYTYKSLKRVESGVAQSGQTVTLPGFWDRQPKIAVSPQSLTVYKASNSTQDQSWACRADNLREEIVGSGVWKFDAVAELQLANASGTTLCYQSSGDTSSNSVDSSQIMLTSVSAYQLSVNVQVRSQQGTGSGTGTWYYRNVLVSVHTYSPSGGWVQSGSKTVAVGATLGSTISATIPCSTLAAGTDRFFVRFTASSDGSTFTSEANSYQYATETITGSGGTAKVFYESATGLFKAVDQYGNVIADESGAKKTVFVMPNYTPPYGWTVDRTTYTYQIVAVTSAYRATQPSITTADGTNFAGSYRDRYGEVYYVDGLQRWVNWEPNYNVFGEQRVGSYYVAGDDSNPSYTVPVAAPPTLVQRSTTLPGSYNPNGLKFLMYGLNGYSPASYNLHRLCEVSNVTATIYLSKLNSNSTTPLNNFTVNSYSWQVSGSVALATGSINYTAVGD